MSVTRIRLLSFSLALSMLLTCLSGCGGSEKKSFVMRTFSTFGSEQDAKPYREIMSAYSKGHRNVVINDTSTTLSGSYKMELSISSTYRGAGTPDVIYYSAISDMSELSDYFMTVDEIRKDYPKFAKSISEAAINSVAADNGNRYCIPIRGQWRGIVINAAMFRRSALRIPETWDDLVRAARHYEKSKVSLFANSLDESGALVEYMIRGLGGMDSLASAMKGTPDDNWETVLEAIELLDGLNAFPKMPKGSFDSLISPTDLKHTAQNKLTSPVELYNSGKAAILLMDNSMCAGINTEIDSKYIALPQIGTVTEDEDEETTTESNSYPSHALSGPVYPPITGNTLPAEETTKAPGGKRSPAPTQSQGPAGSDKAAGQAVSENGLYVNFAEGFYITKKAYYDKTKREDVLDFVEYFLKEESVAKLCGNYQAPSLSKMSDKVRDKLTDKSNIYNGVIKSVQTADSFIVTTQTQENDYFWSHCSMAVACLSKGIITRNEALGLIADTQLTVTDIYSHRQ